MHPQLKTQPSNTQTYEGPFHIQTTAPYRATAPLELLQFGSGVSLERSSATSSRHLNQPSIHHFCHSVVLAPFWGTHYVGISLLCPSGTPPRGQLYLQVICTSPAVFPPPALTICLSPSVTCVSLWSFLLCLLLLTKVTLVCQEASTHPTGGPPSCGKGHLFSGTWDTADKALSPLGTTLD